MKPPRPPRESSVEAAVVRHCRARGLYCRKFKSPSNNGVPDRIICGGGRVMFLELKREKLGRTTALQDYEIGLLTKAGMHAIVAYGRDNAIEAIDDFFLPEGV